MNTNEKISQIATQAGAWVLTAAAMIATTEMLHHEMMAAVPVAVGDGHNQVSASMHEPVSARAEGAKESARMPEEYDIGLRMPTIAGE